MDQPSIILGIGGFLGHDANAALLVNGQVVHAAQEERYSRLKHDGSFPERTITACLQRSGLRADQVTDVVFAEKPLQSHQFHLSGKAGNTMTRWLGKALPGLWPGLYTRPARQLFPRAKFHYAWHHASHVAGAFHTSPFERAAFLCVDGKGEDYSVSAGVVDGREMNILWEQPYENGLGLFYTLITAFLGFHSFGSEYKVMGLAPYGRPRWVPQLSELFTTDENGGFRLRRAVRFLPDSMNDALPWVAETLGVPPRGAGAPLDECHMDMAHSLQHIFEVEILKMARFIRRESGEECLLFCGGCAQNCVTAGRLRREKIFQSLFNSPVGGDMASGLGAAWMLQRTRSQGTYRPNVRGFYLGDEPGIVPPEAEPWRIPVSGDLFHHVATELSEGKIVAWVRGGMELGARALGARSILADARQPGMQSKLNLAVKFRESFRPFAPLVLAECCAEWFDTDEPSDYMQYTADLLPVRRREQPETFANLRERLDFPRSEIGSVIHVDYSARLQTVRPETHPDMHRLLLAFQQQTGVPILINTSFNVSGQPIVRTAAEAWECFIHTDIDLLVVGDALYRNPHHLTREQKLEWLGQFSKAA